MKFAIRIVDDNGEILVQLNDCRFESYSRVFDFMKQIWRSGFNVQIKYMGDDGDE